MDTRERHQRERHHDQDERPTAPALPGGGRDLRAAGERLLARGRGALDRALSQDSAKYLAANQQHGGQ